LSTRPRGPVIGLTRRFTTAGEALAKPAGQTLARFLVLEAVQDQPATVAQVARTLHLARQGVQRLADLLVRDGLAAYQDNPAHRRAKLLRITPHGRATLRTIQARQAAWADAVAPHSGKTSCARPASCWTASSTPSPTRPRPGAAHSSPGTAKR
jgi:DNA-binding MarR family transcriptional regulator